MTLAQAPTRFTPEDLLRLEEDADAPLFELVDGKLVEKPMSFLSNQAASLIIYHLMAFVRQSRAGAVVPEQTFQCFQHDPDRVRIPDVAFITAARALQIPDEGHARIAPDIAIEVISPGNKMNDFEVKLSDYRSAGIPLVWEVNPKLRFIRIHRLDRSSQRLEETDILDGAPVLPGFSIRVSELLPPVEPAAESNPK